MNLHLSQAMHRLSLLLALLLLVSGVSAAEKKLSVVRVNVTTQSWDFLHPWGKRQPFTRRAIGAVLPGARVLVTAELVANLTYLELETPEGGRKVPAAVEAVDYEANLAVLKADDADFLAGAPELQVAESAIGDMLSVWQLENNGRLLVTQGPMTTAETAAYPVDGNFLIYRMTVRLQGRESSFTLPVVHDGKLTGVLMGYDAQSNNANVIPAPVIRHFLKDIEGGHYNGFPRMGYAYSATRDPALRRYAKIPADVTGGIYITDILKGGPAETAGLQKGDVMIAVDDSPVDQDGNFPDDGYGQISLGHLFSTHHFVGDKVKLHILRGGERKTLEATLTHRAPSSYVSDPYIIDQRPRFIVVGGLILQELSRQYLKDFGPDWVRRAPERLVYFDRVQTELFKDGPRKLVFLSRVLPTSATVGYEDLSALLVKKINGVELQSLDDVPKALEKPENGFHKIEFEEDPKTIYLDAAEIQKTERTVQMQYRLPALKFLE
jgi:S1-C subfamily serine protease